MLLTQLVITSHGSVPSIERTRARTTRSGGATGRDYKIRAQVESSPLRELPRPPTSIYVNMEVSFVVFKGFL